MLNLSREQIYIGAAVLLVLVIVVSIVLMKKKEKYNPEVPMNYQLNSLSTNAQDATYTQAYLDPPHLLPLPPKEPHRRLHPASVQPKNYTGIPKSMFKGVGEWTQEYTPDLLWCKKSL